MNKKTVTAMVIVIIIAIITGLGAWQKENIEAIYMYITNDKDSVENILEDNKKKLEEDIKKYSEDVPRMLTPEEEEKIAKGEMSVEEAVELLLSESESEVKANEEDGLPATGEKTEIKENEEKSAENPKEENTETAEKAPVGENSGKNTKDNSKKAESTIIKKYTAQFYSLKAYYVGQLNQIETNAKSEYAALSKEQKKNLSKASFVGKYVSYATSLQSECDSKVNGLLENMKAELKAIGADTSIIGTIKKAYSDEKAARKAYYMNMVS